MAGGAWLLRGSSKNGACEICHNPRWQMSQSLQMLMKLMCGPREPGEDWVVVAGGGGVGKRGSNLKNDTVIKPSF